MATITLASLVFDNPDQLVGQILTRHYLPDEGDRVKETFLITGVDVLSEDVMLQVLNRATADRTMFFIGPDIPAIASVQESGDFWLIPHPEDLEQWCIFRTDLDVLYAEPI